MKWSCILIISILLSCSSRENKKLYEQKMEELQDMLSTSSYNILIDYFKEEHERFPDSLKEVYHV